MVCALFVYGTGLSVYGDPCRYFGALPHRRASEGRQQYGEARAGRPMVREPRLVATRAEVVGKIQV
jgi:hypothetical protein